jgi:hypothetical protein
MPKCGDEARVGSRATTFRRRGPRYIQGEEIRHYLDHLKRTTAMEDEQARNEDDDELFGDFPDRLAAMWARLAQLKELLTSTVLGTG